MLWYSFVGFVVFAVIIIAKNYTRVSAQWLFFILVGFCLSVLGLMFYSVYMWDYSYELRQLFFNLNKRIWLMIYYFKLDPDMVMRMINIGTSLYSYSAACLSIYLVSSKSKKIKLYTLLLILPLLLVVFYDPEALKALYRLHKWSAIGIPFKTMMHYANLLNTVWIKLYISLSILVMTFAYSKCKNNNYKKRILYLITGITPIHILYIILFYWVPQPFVVLRSFDVAVSKEPGEITQLLTLNLKYGRFTYASVIVLSIVSMALLVFAIIKHRVFDLDIERDRQVFSNAMQTANQSFKVFSHSIKNEIVTIRLISEGLRGVTEGDAKRRQMSEDISNICNEVINKLNALRNYTRLQNKDICRLVNVADILEEVIDGRIVPDGIRLNLSTKNAFRVMINEEVFKEIAKNILVNAIEALKDQEDGFVNISFDTEHEWGIVIFEDNGVGIVEEDMTKIFSPFFTTKETSNNWGIGLSFCKEAIEAYGGEIHISSKSGEGTIFRIFIPLNKRRRAWWRKESSAS